MSVAVARPQLIVFQSERCGRSRRVEGFLSLVLQRRHNHETFTVYRVFAERHPHLFDKFRVEETPTLVVAEQKRVRARLIRPAGAREISAFLEPWLR
jgi:hypothetical protein